MWPATLRNNVEATPSGAIPAALSTAARNLRTWAQALPVISELHRKGIPTLVIKSLPQIEDLYGRPDGRATADVDLLVPGDHAREAMELLLARNWQLTEERWWSVLEPLDGAVRAAARRPWHFVRNRAGLVSVIDLHSDAIDLWPILPLDTVIWKRAVRVERDGVEFLVLGEEDRLIFLCWHFFQHSIVPGIPWEKLRDIQLVLRAGEGLDRAYLATRARQVGVTLFVRLACELARVVDPECTSAEWISTLPVAAPRRYAALRRLFLRRQDRMSHPERLVFWLLAHDRPLDMLPVWRDLIVPSRLRIGGQYLGHMPDWPEYLQTVWTLYSRRLRRLV